MNSGEKEKQPIFPFFFFTLLVYSILSLNVDKPTGNVLTFTHRKRNQPTAIFFNHFSKAKTNGMEWIIFYILAITCYSPWLCIIFVHSSSLNSNPYIHFYWQDISSVRLKTFSFQIQAEDLSLGSSFLLLSDTHTHTHTIDDNEV